jgi:predicted cupin superfamily sugar epimerase
MRDRTAVELIAKLGMQPHPEGGWYAETWRGEALEGGRPIASLIYFLLEAGQRSHWHKVDAAEIWLWHAGSPVELAVAPGEAGPVERVALGGDVLAGQQPQRVIAPGHWQATTADAGWALVSCVVAPAFRFDGFALAAPGWQPG